MTKRLRPFILSALVVLADQLTKAWIVATIPEDGVGYSFLGGFLRIIHVRNDAVAFSLGSSLDVPLKIVLFIALPIALVSFLSFLIVSSRHEGELTELDLWCLAGIVGGGVGNLVDRLFRSLRVVDWISVRMYGLLGMEYFPTWNIADAAVVCEKPFRLSYSSPLLEEDLNKKANSVIFMIVATVVNIILMGVLFIVGLVILNLIASAFPDTALIPALILIVFIGAIALSFMLYSRLVKWAMKKFDLEDRMDPIFSSKRNSSRSRLD